ncbi:MAG: prolipoprotein diacylglyceryl transferase [Solirubrobacteraceae bacterium]|nr:prolipoprotein diacylglyceryl transferase [Patulibacter sp.]
MIRAIHLGPLTIQSFGLCVALAFLAAGAVLYRRFAELGWDPDLAYEATGAALVGGIAGARIWWAVGDPSALVHDPVHQLVGSSGLTWYGGAIGGALAVLAFARWRKVSMWDLAGAATAPLALGYALGRIGCQVSGDGDYGVPSTVKWAMSYPHGVVPTKLAVLPTPIFETFFVGLIALVLWRLRDRLSPQWLFALYLIGTGVERFIIEFWRRNPDVDGFLTVAQITSVIMVALGGALAIWMRSRERPPLAH